MNDVISNEAPPARASTLRIVVLVAIIILAAASIAAAVLLLGNRDATTDSGSRLDRLVTMLPDELEGRAELLDLEAMSQQIDVDRPAPGSSVEEGAAFLTAHFEGESGISFPEELRRSVGQYGVEEAFAAFRSDMGIELEQITAWAEWGVAGDQGTILIGTFDEAAVDAAARSNDWPGEMTEHEYRGVTYYAWLDEYTMNIGEATITNRMGETRRIAVIDDLYIVAKTTPQIEAAIDRALDGSGTDTPAGSRAVTGALIDATRSEPPDHVVIFIHGHDSFTYNATAYRGPRSASETSAYAMAFGLDAQVAEDAIAGEVELLIEDFSNNPSVLHPESGPDAAPFDELYDHSVEGRILTITRIDRA